MASFYDWLKSLALDDPVGCADKLRKPGVEYTSAEQILAAGTAEVLRDDAGLSISAARVIFAAAQSKLIHPCSNVPLA